jgi:polyhydroxyalkanoate synthesis regulator protein
LFFLPPPKTDEDITRSVLLQVIAEQEEAGQPIFTIPILTQVIRFYGDAAQGLASEFLQRSLVAFGEQQRLFRRHLDDAMAKDAFGAMSDLAKQNLEMWKDAQGAWFGAGEERKSGEATDPGRKRPAGKGKAKGSRPRR